MTARSVGSLEEEAERLVDVLVAGWAGPEPAPAGPEPTAAGPESTAAGPESPPGAGPAFDAAAAWRRRSPEVLASVAGAMELAAEGLTAAAHRLSSVASAARADAATDDEDGAAPPPARERSAPWA